MIVFKKGGEKMKKINAFITKILPAFVACMTLVLTVSANSSSCAFLNEPKEPTALKNFKKF